MEARLRCWNGLGREDRWAQLGGRLVAAASRHEPPFWVWNGGLKQLYLSSFHLAPGNAKAYLQALKGYQVRYMLGYASAMSSLAWLVRKEGLVAPRLEAVLNNGEPLFQSQRESLQEVFQAPVRDSYGMAELACAASECSAGRLHLWPEVGVTEVLSEKENTAVPAGVTGRLVCTGLLNEDMPLIRYETGDLGAVEEASEACGCGRTLPALAKVEGRLDDLIITPDGRRIGRLDAVFRGSVPLRGAQVVQDREDRVIVRLVPTEGWNSRWCNEVEGRLRDRLGPAMKIEIEIVRELERESSGKLRVIISEISSR